jgi:hypothetical protein
MCHVKRNPLPTFIAIAVVVALGVAVGVWLASRNDTSRDDVVTTPITIEVRVQSPSDLDQTLGRVADRIRHLTLPGSDGVLAARAAPALIQAARGREHTCVLEVDPREARRFGDDPAATGMVGFDAPPEGKLILNQRLDGRLGDRDEQLTVAVADRRQRFAVDRVVPTVGLASYCGAIVPPGTIVAMSPPSADSTATGLVWISFAAKATDEDIERAVTTIRDEVGGPGVEVSRDERR